MNKYYNFCNKNKSPMSHLMGFDITTALITEVIEFKYHKQKCFLYTSIIKHIFPCKN